MISKSHLDFSMNPARLFEWFKYKRNFNKEHPDYFRPDGLCVFVGAQGSGKTLSAVNYVIRLLNEYPKAILVTNLFLPQYPFDDVRVFPFVDNDDFAKYSNGEYGVIFLVDEIHLYLNSLESKNINLDVVAQISQQRKQRKHIVATSQVFGRLAKPLREQFSAVVLCKSSLGGAMQFNQLLLQDDSQKDKDSATVTGVVIGNYRWWRTPSMFEQYDTSFVVERGKFGAGEQQKKQIYERKENIGNA